MVELRQLMVRTVWPVLLPLLLIAGSLSFGGSSAVAEETCGLGLGWAPYTNSPLPGPVLDMEALSSSDIWAVGGSMGTFTGHWDGSTWSTVPSPSPGTTYYNDSNVLQSVATLSPTNVWAAGTYVEPEHFRAQTLIEHWDGAEWTVIRSPNVRRTRNYLYGISSRASDDIWAVGYYYNRTARTHQTLIEHWDGSSWSIVPSQNLPGANFLYGVTAVAPDDVWAVGTVFDSGYHPLIQHWNGTAWSIVPVADAVGYGDSIQDVIAVESNDVWAVGWDAIRHWDGSEWSIVHNLPDDLSLHAISAVSANDIWVAGRSYDYYQGPLAFFKHWDGTAWRTAASGGVAPAEAIAALPDDTWAGGVPTGSYPNYTSVSRFCPALVQDSGFVPRTIDLAQGDSVTWEFDDSNTTNHSIVVGSGLFDSGTRAPGSIYSLRFVSAGSYRLRDAHSPNRGSIQVPLLFNKKKGTTASKFKITYSAGQGPSGYVTDLQVLRPGETEYADWLTGLEGTTAIFYADAGAGTYAFQARYRHVESGGVSDWSAAKSIDVTALNADLSVSIADAPDPIAAGELLTYSIVVSNAGPYSASNVTFTDPLPSNVVWESTSPASSCSGSSTVSCSFGSLAPNTSIIITIKVRPTTAGTITNSATVDTSSPDPDPSNDSTTATTRVAPAGCTTIGTDGDDTLLGTDAADVICGLDGNDEITPGDGDDTVRAGYGLDTVHPSQGADVIVGGPDDDTLSGGLGNDELYGEGGFDTLDGGADTDTCNPGPDGGTTTNCESV